MQIHADNLRGLVTDILAAKGALHDVAKLVATQLVESNLVGHDSHGVVRLSAYLERIDRGEINVRANIHVTRDNPASVTIDGDWGFGQLAVEKALDLAMEKAQRQGVCHAGVFNCNDVGRLGWYTTRAAEQGFVTLLTINDGGSNPYVTPWGGVRALMSTNPISAGFPVVGGVPICVDLSTSICAGGKIQVALKRDERLPDGLIIDGEGNPTNDARDFYSDPPGALLPLGAPNAGHKGFALSLMVDILSGALSGAGCSGNNARDAQGVFLLVTDLNRVTDTEVYAAQVEQLIHNIKTTPKAAEVDAIRIPGERGNEEKRKRAADGIYIENVTWQEIVLIADKLGIDTP